ncbi:MAG TPA: 3-dehydroquinate synthase [Candidatus Binataceae bacterium]|nr:3-dehydroquinate synthase [Candidatus Binataceae bacterium]
MGSFRVDLGANAHPVETGAGLLDRLGALALAAGLTAGRAVIVTDDNVARLYGARAATALAAAGFSAIVIEVAAGEASKSIATLGALYDRMVAAQLDRSSVVFALGGGVVGDLAGFAAATYLRGIAVVQVPTTMTAQVDSALGGKTGVNHPAAKNLIGAFHQPRLIVADIVTLATLPEREFREGLAEVIKYGAIMDAPMIAGLEAAMPAILRRDPARLAEIVDQSLRHKAAVVQRDEREGGLRKILNFGHTIGHALEASAGYGSYFHGEAVAIGMAAAAALSRAHSGLGAADAARLVRLIEAAGLPTRMPAGWRGEDFERALRLDKKRARDGVEFVLLDRLGHALTRSLGFAEILAPFA